jgi:hypothetical protein
MSKDWICACGAELTLDDLTEYQGQAVHWKDGPDHGEWCGPVSYREPVKKEAASAATYEVPIGSHLSHCRGCGQAIFWVRTRSGASMPVNPGPKTSHFTTCPKAAAFSRKKKETP